MHTHSVISQRSPNWFYFLVKPTSLHTTSPAPAFAIQMYSQTAGHPGRFIPMMLLFLFFFFFFHVSKSNISLSASPMLYFDPWERENSFSLPSLWKTTKVEALGSQWSGQQDAGRQSNSHSRWEDGSEIIVFPKLWQHVNILTHSKAWHPGRKNANSGWGRHWDIFLTFEKICFKFTAHMLRHSVVYAELFWRSGPF